MSECPSCGGAATERWLSDYVHYGQPPVPIPYACIGLHCEQCGDFTDWRGEEARAAAVAAYKAHQQECSS